MFRPKWVIIRCFSLHINCYWITMQHSYIYIYIKYTGHNRSLLFFFYTFGVNSNANIHFNRTCINLKLDLVTMWRWVVRFTPPGTHWMGGWLGPRACLDVVEKRKMCPAGIRTPAVQPVIDVGGKTILHRILDKDGGVVSTGFIWLRKEASSGPLWNVEKFLNSWATSGFSTQEGVSCRKLVMNSIFKCYVVGLQSWESQWRSCKKKKNWSSLKLGDDFC
jgi:hypothetical protein